MPSFWPSQLDYQDALALPTVCLNDGELAACISAEQTPFGTPSPIAGQFANVYRMRQENGREFAVRFFLRAESDRTERWRAFERHLTNHPSLDPYFVPFAYQERGIHLPQGEFPLVKMLWQTGELLNEAVGKRLYEATYLRGLAQTWHGLVSVLASARFAHGDFQHGNILVSGDAMRLVDLDGAWVPIIATLGGRERGHPSYNHPRRATGDWGANMDKFPALVIYVALRVLAVVPQTWYRLDNGDNLLFAPADFVHPTQSRAFAVLNEALRTCPEEKRLVNVLRAACDVAPAEVPTLESLRV